MTASLAASYGLATASMAAGAVYLLWKTRGKICTTSMLLGFLLIFYGPAYLLYMLHYNVESVIYRKVVTSPYFDDGVLSLNLAIAILYCGFIAGVEIADRIGWRRRERLNLALQQWNASPLLGNPYIAGPLIAINLALCAYMVGVSIYENHVGVILGFFRAGDTAVARDEYRLFFSGTRFYPYRLILASIAPFFAIWGILEAWVRRSKLLMAISALLLLVTLLGRVEMLSRAPVAFMVVQLGLAVVFCFRNRVTWQLAGLGSLAAVALFYPLIELTIPETARSGTVLSFFFRRAFFISNETLLEFFSAFPYYLSHTWGANIRPLAYLMGVEFHPAHEEVSYLWRNERGSVSNAMFIADAWADFSFWGVVVESILVGVLCRTIDLTILSRGKSATSVAVLTSMVGAVLTLMLTSAQTAMLTGGLLSVPLLALGVTGIATLIRGRLPATAAPAVEG